MKNSRKRPDYWVDVDERWEYHQAAIEIIKESDKSSPEKVLEIGTIGATLVENSHTMDYDLRWNVDGMVATYNHDIRMHPWPIPDKSYDWLIALRVFHHLFPVQRMCFREAQRVSRNVLIVVPDSVGYVNFKKPKMTLRRLATPTVKGVGHHHVKKWNNDVEPTIAHKYPRGDLYFWASEEMNANSSEKPVKKWEVLAGKGVARVDRAIQRVVGKG